LGIAGVLFAPTSAEAISYCSGGTLSETFYNALALVPSSDPFAWIPSPSGSPATFKTLTANPNLNPRGALPGGWLVVRSKATDASCAFIGNPPIAPGDPTLILTPGNRLQAAVLDTPLSGDGGILVGEGFTFVINNPNSTHTGFIKTEGTSVSVNNPGRLGGSGTTQSTIINQGVVFVGPDHGQGNAGFRLTVGSYSQSFRSAGDAAPQLQLDVAGQTTDRLVVLNQIPDNGLRGEVHVAGTPLPGVTYVLLQGPPGSHEPAGVSPQNFVLQFDSYVIQQGTKVAYNADGDPTTMDFAIVPDTSQGSGGAFQTAAGKDRRHSQGTKQVARIFDKSTSLLIGAGGTAANTNPKTISAPSGGSTGITQTTATQALGKRTTPSAAADFVRVLHEVIAQPTADAYLNALRSLEAQPYATNQTVTLEAMERLRTDLFGSTDGSGLTRLTTEEQICLDKDRKKPANQDIDSCNKVRTVTRPLPWSVLIHASNSTAALDGTEQLASADYSIFQSLYGLQYDFSRDWAAGAAFGYGRTMLYDYAYSSVSIDSDTYSGVFWGIYTPSDLWKFSGLVGYSNFDYSSRRRILFGAIDRTARGDWGVNGFTGALDAEYDWILNPSSELPSVDNPDPNRNATRLKPRAFLSYASATQDSFTESGAESLDLATPTRPTQWLQVLA